jgi:hypothetical protein
LPARTLPSGILPSGTVPPRTLPPRTLPPRTLPVVTLPGVGRSVIALSVITPSVITPSVITPSVIALSVITLGGVARRCVEPHRLRISPWPGKSLRLGGCPSPGSWALMRPGGALRRGALRARSALRHGAGRALCSGPSVDRAMGTGVVAGNWAVSPDSYRGHWRGRMIRYRRIRRGRVIRVHRGRGAKVLPLGNARTHRPVAGGVLSSKPIDADRPAAVAHRASQRPGVGWPAPGQGFGATAVGLLGPEFGCAHWRLNGREHRPIFRPPVL